MMTYGLIFNLWIYPNPVFAAPAARLFEGVRQIPYSRLGDETLESKIPLSTVNIFQIVYHFLFDFRIGNHIQLFFN